MRSIYLLPLALLACGDNKSGPVRPDGPPRIDAATDAPGVQCDYDEMADGTNDDLFGSGTAEVTGLSFTNTTLSICGEINNGHFNTTEMNVDVDSYRISVPADTLGILHLTAPGADVLESVSLEISGLTTATAVSEVGVLVTDFATTAATLVPGDYLITVSSYNAADAAAALDYKIAIELDSATRCPASTAAVNFAEANDGALESGNDVIEIRDSGTPARQYTALGTDNPEPTNLTIAPNTSYHVTGTTAFPATAPVSWMDAYQDRDTYAITTGAGTNTLAIRLNWPGTTSDLDFFVFPSDDINEIATGWYKRNAEEEFTTFAVAPNTQYYVTVAADDDGADADVDYDITLCGTTHAAAAAAPSASSETPRRRGHPVFQRTVRPLAKK